MFCARCLSAVGSHDRVCAQCNADLTLPGSVRLTDPRWLNAETQTGPGWWQAKKADLMALGEQAAARARDVQAAQTSEVVQAPSSQVSVHRGASPLRPRARVVINQGATPLRPRPPAVIGRGASPARPRPPVMVRAGASPARPRAAAQPDVPAAPQAAATPRPAPARPPRPRPAPQPKPRSRVSPVIKTLIFIVVLGGIIAGLLWFLADLLLVNPIQIVPGPSPSATP